MAETNQDKQNRRQTDRDLKRAAKENKRRDIIEKREAKETTRTEKETTRTAKVKQRIAKSRPAAKFDRRIAKLASPSDVTSLESRAGTDVGDLPMHTALWLMLKHPREFIAGGFRSVLDTALPVVAPEAYRSALSLPLHAYIRYMLSHEFRETVSWMGVPTLKIISDLWVYQEIIYRTKPDLIVEIGSYFGGSTLFFAHMLELIGAGEVVSIDRSHDKFMADHPRIRKITGDSADPEILSQIKGLANGKSTMIVHDADHTYSAVKRDIASYAPLVSVGHYLIIEDGIVDIFNSERCVLWDDNEGPLRAIAEFLEEQEGRFIRDMGAERFLATTNPSGFLRRSK